MLLADTIIEQDGVFLRNLIKNAPAQDVWSTASGSYPLFTCYLLSFQVNVFQVCS